MNTLEDKLVAMRSALLEAFPARAPQIHLLLTALLARGHVLLDDYEGSGCRELIFALDELIAGNAPDEFTRIQCHPGLIAEDVLPLIIQGDVVILDRFNCASRQFQILIGQLLRDGHVLIPNKTTGEVRVFKLPEAILITARVNHYEGGVDAIPYDVSGSFLSG